MNNQYEFSIKTNRKIYDQLTWIAAAVSQDELYPELHVIAVTNKRIISTDGYRVHMLRLNYSDAKIEEGFYKVKSVGKKILLTEHVFGKDQKEFPGIDKIAKIFPRHMKKDFKLINDNCHKSIGYTELVRELPEKRTIDFRYYSEAVGDISEWSVYLGKKYEGVLLKSEFRTAIVMYLTIGVRREY